MKYSEFEIQYQLWLSLKCNGRNIFLFWAFYESLFFYNHKVKNM